MTVDASGNEPSDDQARLTVGQVRFMLASFLFVTASVATHLFYHTKSVGVVADFLGYALPCGAAVLAGAKLYLGSRVSEAGLYQGSIFLLFLGMLFNAYVHPCGASVIVLMCVGSGITFVIVLGWRVFRFKGERGLLGSFAAGFSPVFMFAMVAFSIALAIAFWPDLFFYTSGRAQCPLPSPH